MWSRYSPTRVCTARGRYASTKDVALVGRLVSCPRHRAGMSQATETYNILLVDDDAAVIAALTGVLRQFGRVRFARSGQEALRLAEASPPDLVLLDLGLPDMSGYDVFAALKQTPGLAALPVMFITSNEDVEHEIQCLSLGAADFITKPPRTGQVAARVRLQQRLHQMTLALREAAAIDALTGLANRRQFDEALGREWLRARRTGTPIALLMADIDSFKAYNDHYGHPAGDECLRSVANALRLVTRRPTDVLARYGGEEFAFLLPETDACGAARVAKNAIRALEAAGLEHAASTTASHVTVSIGLTCFQLPESTYAQSREVTADQLRRPASDLVMVADRALYRCKQAGRNHARYLAFDDYNVPERAVDVCARDPQLEIGPENCDLRSLPRESTPR